MNLPSIGLAVVAGLATLSVGSCAARQDAQDILACHVGVYRFADGSFVDVGPETAGRSLRWRTLDGENGLLERKEDGPWRSTKGWTGKRDGIEVRFGACGDGWVSFAGRPGRKVDFDVTDTVFEVKGAKLAGRLVMPQGADAVPILVMIHGSEDSSARRYYYEQRLMPAQGIGAFIYDKRGTGRSTGSYTQDFDVLSDDAVAAVKEARRLAGVRVSRLGLQGSSQGGWVAPLTAAKVEVDFVISAFGLAVSPLEENRMETLQGLEAKGYRGADLAKANEVAVAAGDVVASGFTDGFDRLEALKRRYRHEAWFGELEGEFTDDLVKYPPLALRIFGPISDSGTTWAYNPMPLLSVLDTPMLWILAGADTEAPMQSTKDNLQRLIQAGRPVSAYVYPNTEHGMFEFEVGEGGQRLWTRNPSGYFKMIGDFVRGDLKPTPYGAAQKLTP